MADVSAEALRFPVVESFTSVNGEGTRAGRLAAFVRFRGCTLSCSYCDTAWANRHDAPAEMLGIDDIVSFVESSPASCVTLTGGEPLLQNGIDELIEALLADPKRFVEVETNGAVPLAPFAAMRRRLLGSRCGHLSFTMDCKLPSSGMHEHMVWENYELLEPSDTVKFVIGDDRDFETVLQVMSRFDLQAQCHTYLSPVFDRMDPARIVDFMRENSLDNTTLQLQLHKIIWPGQDKGV